MFTLNPTLSESYEKNKYCYSSVENFPLLSYFNPNAISKGVERDLPNLILIVSI